MVTALALLRTNIILSTAGVELSHFDPKSASVYQKSTSVSQYPKKYHKHIKTLVVVTWLYVDPTSYLCLCKNRILAWREGASVDRGSWKWLPQDELNGNETESTALATASLCS